MKSCHLAGGVLILSLTFGGCTVHQVLNRPPCVAVPEEYSEPLEGKKIGISWWEEFENRDLNSLVEQALCQNFEIQQAWDRFVQARALLCIANAGKIPEIDFIANLTHTRSNRPLFGVNDLIQGEFLTIDPSTFGTEEGSLNVGLELLYEVDLWKRIDSQVRAASQVMMARKNELEAIALTVTSQVTELWLKIQERRAQIALLHEQIAADKTRLELVELRWSVGDSSGLDVFQQRLQLSATENELPPVRQELILAIHELQVVLGVPPGGEWDASPAPLALTFPEEPSIGTPWDLICNRPDLRAEQHNLLAADYGVAVAIADRFPKLTVFSLAELATSNLHNVFTDQILNVGANVLLPIVDGNRRICEVHRRQAILWETINRYSARFLIALREVEDSVHLEKEQKLLLDELYAQEEIAKTTLFEAQIRYSNGLTNYLDVIVSVNALQNVQRRIITEKTRLFTIRKDLYVALGGAFCL